VIKAIFLLKTTGRICHERGADDDGAKGQILVSLKYWTFLLPTFTPPKSIPVCKNLRFLIQFTAKNQKSFLSLQSY
jgi:hypothetical protein